MKITKAQLKQLIKEELEKVLKESWDKPGFTGGQWSTAASYTDLEPDVRSQTMKLAYNLYQVSGQTMSEDVKAALAALEDYDLLKHVLDARRAVEYYGWDRLHAAGGAEGLFQAILRLK